MNVNLFVIIIMLLGFVVGLFSPHHPEFLMKGKKTKRSTNVLLRNDNSNIQTELKHLLCDDLKPSLNDKNVSSTTSRAAGRSSRSNI